MTGRVLRTILLSFVAGAVLAAQQVVVQPQGRPTFRTRTTLRTVEVRVIDQKFKPVTGLTQADFTLEENGVPQEIRAFSPINLTADPEAAAPLTALQPDAARKADGAVSNRRVFLIVLGRGDMRNPNHQNPSKAVDGLIHFVRDLLLPQDLVGVFVWNRATDFTTNRDQIVRMLERYKKDAARVESLLEQHFSGLAAIYGNRDMPTHVTKEINTLLRGLEVPTKTTLPGPSSTAAAEQGMRSNTALLLETSVRGPGSFDLFAAERANSIGMTLDEYASGSVQTLQDLARIYAGLEYLRHFEGEKQMIYIANKGLAALPSADDGRSLARVAQDAGVRLNILHSCGMCASFDSIAASEDIAEYSGGQFTGLTYGARFLERVDASTRTSYQLGYYPSDALIDGKYRKISVKVKGRGLTVLYGRGYYARDEPALIDRRQVISQSRIEAAVRYPLDVRDLSLLAAAAPGRNADGKMEMLVQVNVEPAGIKVTGEGENRSVSLDVAVICFDRQFTRTYVVGQMWHRVQLDLADEDRYQQFLKTGVGFTVRVPIRRSANVVKAIVYDYAADRVGTVLPKIK